MAATKRKSAAKKAAPKKAAPKKAAPKKAAAKKEAATKKKPPKPTPQYYLKNLRDMTDKDEPGWGMLAEDLFASAVKERVSTGSLAIDKITGGGWPVTRVIEVASWENVGKSTLLDQGMAQNQRAGGISAVVDTESARDEAYTARLGVNIDELITSPCKTIEQVFGAIDKLLDLQEKVMSDMKGQAPVMMIVWDAVGGTPTLAEVEGAADDKHVGVAARNIKMNLRRICLRLAECRALIIAANHFYQTIGGPFSTIKTYGGTGIRYFSSLRIWLTNKGQIKIGETAVGHIVEAKVKKTRIGKPQPPVQTGLIWGAGFDNSYTLFDWGQKAGVNDAHRWIVRHGAWYYLMRPDGTHEAFKQKFVGLGQIFQAQPDLYQQMADQYLAEAV